MKRIITLATVTLMSFANVVGAMTPTDTEVDKIHQYASMADTHVLTDAQIHDLLAIIDSNDSENSKRTRVNLVLQRYGWHLWN